MVASAHWKMPGRRAAGVASILGALAALSTAAMRQCAADDMANVLAEFKVSPSGDLLTLPVTIGERSYSCILDTGVSWWFFDESLRPLLGAFTDRAVIQTAEGKIRHERYAMPPVRLGSMEVPARSSAACTDAHDRDMHAGVDVYGVIGTEFLRDKIFRIDFDHGRLQFLAGVPDGAGERFDVVWKWGVPWLVLDVPGAGKEEFQLNTENNAFETGVLRKALFDHLVATAVIRRVGEPQLVGRVDDDWIRTSPVGRMDDFAVGPFHHRGAAFTAGAQSELGLSYLSRYTVTFDLAHSAVYLKPGRGYARPERYSGLAGLFIGSMRPKSTSRAGDDMVLTTMVQEGGPAERAGIAYLDEILQIDGSPAASTTLFELRRMLATPGTHRVRFGDVGRKGRNQKEATIVLREPDEKPEEQLDKGH